MAANGCETPPPKSLNVNKQHHFLVQPESFVSFSNITLPKSILSFLKMCLLQLLTHPDTPTTPNNNTPINSPDYQKPKKSKKTKLTIIFFTSQNNPSFYPTTTSSFLGPCHQWWCSSWAPPALAGHGFLLFARYQEHHRYSFS